MHRSNKIFTLLLFLTSLFASADEYTLYKTARGHWFKNEWSQAVTLFEQLVREYPDSPRRCRSQNFIGYCYQKMGDKDKAFETFSELIEKGTCKKDILDDAKSERLELAYESVKQNPDMKKVLIDALTDENEDIRLMAAVYLSRLGDPSGLEVFFYVVNNSKDQDVRDTASRHILKLGSETDKDRLQKIIASKQTDHTGPAKMVKLIIRNVETNEIEQKLSFPIGLFSLLIKMLKSEQLEIIKEEAGIDLQNLDLDLTKMPAGTVIFQVIDKEGQEIKIFLE